MGRGARLRLDRVRSDTTKELHQLAERICGSHVYVNLSGIRVEKRRPLTALAK